MADRNIDQAKANAWIKDVQEEIALVNKILRENGKLEDFEVTSTEM